MNNTIYIFLFTVLIILGTHMYLINPRKLFHQLNALVLFLCAGVVLTEWNIFNARHHFDVKYYDFYHTSLVGMVTLVELLCAYYFARPFENKLNEKSINRLFNIGMSLLFLFVFYCAKFDSDVTVVLQDKVDDKWAYILNYESFYEQLLFFWYLISLVIMGVCFFMAYHKATIKRERVWKFWLFIAFTILPIAIFITFLWAPAQATPAHFELSVFLFFLVCTMSWVYSNFKLFELNPSDAMHDILESVSNLVFITDTSFMVKHQNILAREVLNKFGPKNTQIDILTVLGGSDGVDIYKFKNKLLNLGVREKLETKFSIIIDDVARDYLVLAMKVIRKDNHTGYSFIATDISTLVEKEKQLQDYNDLLENKNQELERFAYIASHDLKTPLRNIISFITLIKRKLKSHSDMDLKEFINITQSNAESMYHLIEEILEYSLVKTKEVKKTEVDMQEVFSLIEKNLIHYVEEKNATIKYDKLPVLEANHHQMVQLFQNLIENGLKYNNSENPKVTISVFPEGEYLVFKVEDNGIGINQEYHKTVFEIFKRLHNQSEYQGSGVGLAICNKIVTNHGGYIELISVENVGSIFMVHLKPKHEVVEEKIEIMEAINMN